MTEPSARIIADSVSPAGHRLTTFEVVMHRFVLAEFNTHRVFSRNSASSRAIPFPKQVERVETSPAVPVIWPAEQKGMQGGDEIEETPSAEYFWLKARDRAIDNAKNLADLGVHKSVVNRLLEPFMWHTVVVTATAWQNFFGLRCNPMAQPEIRIAADFMAEEYRLSTPREVRSGEWHLPYIQDDERDDMPLETQIKVSAARCARVSYLTQNGVRDFEQDVQLYDRLTSADPMHASPLEHVATPDSSNATHQCPVVHDHWSSAGCRTSLTLPRYGNFLGWHQHRFDVEVARLYQAFS